MVSLNDNPFAVLAAVVAPAILTNVGSVLAFYNQQLGFRVAATAGLATGAFGVTGLVTGCLLMVRETRFAPQNIAEESAPRARRE